MFVFNSNITVNTVQQGKKMIELGGIDLAKGERSYAINLHFI